MIDPADYVVPVALRDGTRVTLRAVRHADAPKIRAAFHHLTADSVYARFFGHKRDVSDAELHHITNVDFIRDAALLATCGAGAAEIVVGGASAFALDAEIPPRAAEVAFTVEEDYQGKGLASLLLRHLMEICRGNGIRQLEADVLVHNAAMLGVFEHAGLPMSLRHEGETVHVTMALDGVISAAP